MRPTCFLLRESGTGVLLYLGEVSTEECLRIFDPEARTTIQEFGATSREGEWVDESNLPAITNVNDLLMYLGGRPDLSLANVTVKLGDEQLSTHDDGEAHLVFRNEGDALAFLRKAVDDPALEEIVSCLRANPDRYVAERDGRLRIYETFDGYLIDAHVAGG